MQPLNNLFVIPDGTEFKINNRNEWDRNSEFWLEGRMQHIVDIQKSTVDLIKYVFDKFREKEEDFKLIDEGCGEGWLYRIVRELGLNCDYVGIDFNEKFITALKARYFNDDQARFIFFDVEDMQIIQDFGNAHLVVNAFNFFELPEIETAFSNTVELIRDEGYLLIMTIDPITQILSISEDIGEFYNNLQIYASSECKLGYRKKIVVGKEKTERVYYGILYSTEDILNLASDNKLELVKYKEIINATKFAPQQFQFFLFKKKQ